MGRAIHEVSTGVLDALWEHVAVLDADGRIAGVNRAWETFAELNGGSPRGAEGEDYVALCRAAGDHDLAARLERLLAGELASVQEVQSCDAPFERRWFTLDAAPLRDGGALITYTPATDRVLIESYARAGHPCDPITGLPPLIMSDGAVATVLDRDGTGRAPTPVVVVDVGTEAVRRDGGRRAELGERGGRAVLLQAASRLVKLAGTRDLAFSAGVRRLLLISGTDGAPDALVERVERTLAHPFQIGPEPVVPSFVVRAEHFDSLSDLHRIAGDLGARADVAHLARGHARHIAARAELVSERSAMPELVVQMHDLRLRRANDAALELFGLIGEDLTQRHAFDLLVPAERDDVAQAIEALRTGSVDMYRVRRRLQTVDGPLECWVWARSIPERRTMLALVTAWPLDSAEEPPAPAPMGLELAVGTTDRVGHLLSARVSGRLFDDDDRAPLFGRPLSAWLHPDDAHGLEVAIREVDGAGRTVAARVLHAQRGWVMSEISLFVTAADSVGFVISERESSERSATRLLVDVQTQLRRITEELSGHVVSAVGPQAAIGPPVPPLLNVLTARQREVIRRLMAGERVGTIARRMYVSPSTVRNHLSTAYRAFGVRNQTELIETLRSLGVDGVVD